MKGRIFIILLATALATVPSITASPVQTLELHTRNAAACADPHAAIDPSCWNTLGLTHWLRKWKLKTPTCTGQDTSACCGQHEPWSTCFLRLAESFAGSSCYNIDGCLYNGAPLSTTLHKSDLPKYHYVIYNIYGLIPTLNCFLSYGHHC